ncbi:MAG: flavodoxin family protein [Gammaproteobacteria bacterium]|nr:MAG: flavodoxin family protein [Gammaproteobacteria bacterium]
MKKNLLIINAHQFYEGVSPGDLNQTLTVAIREEMEKHGYAVRQTNIEQGYDIDEEVQKHLWADIIILQAPVYWFSAPWIYKKYADEIFTAGLVQQNLIIDDGRTRQDPRKQYGTGGKMHGKKYMISLTWNAPAESFGNKDQRLFEGKTVDEIFIGNTANYKFCGADILPSFSCFDVVKNADVEMDLTRLRKHLDTYIFSKEFFNESVC